MSEIEANIAGAAQAVENSISAALKDFSGGIGSFITGGHARTHDPKPVEELDGARTKKEAEAAAQDGQINTNLTDLTGTQQKPAHENDNGFGI